MRRRSLLAMLGAVGTGGCLRLQQGGDESAATRTRVPAGGDADTTSTAGESPTQDTPHSDAERYALSERWTADFGVDFVLTDDGHFYFNDFNLAGEAIPGDGVLWSDEVEYEGSTANLGADAIGRGSGIVVYGFFSEPQSVDDPGAHLVAYDGAAGGEQWTFTVPAAGENEYTNLPRGVAIVDGVAVVGLNGQSVLQVYGLDAETGERLWEVEREGGIHDLGAHGGEIYVNSFGGVFALDPATGDVTDRHESWRGGTSRIQGNSLFAGRDGLQAYPLADGGVEWSGPDVSGINTLVVDNSLVAAGTHTGGVHAVERATGESRWDVTMDGTVWQIALGSRHVWVADRETGLTAYDRRDGRNVHRSNQPIDRADIAVVSGSILLGNDTARLYDIEPA